jgi:hypothetical protein
MNLKAINICMHELREIHAIFQQLVLDLVIRFNKRGNIQMRSISNPIDGMVIDAGVIFIVLRICFVDSFSRGGGVLERTGKNLPAFREDLGLSGGNIESRGAF